MNEGEATDLQGDIPPRVLAWHVIAQRIGWNRSHRDTPIVYFAHSKRLYRSPAAAAVRALIRSARPDALLFDPSDLDEDFTHLIQLLGGWDGYYSFIAEATHEIVALEHESHIGRGVYRELEESRAHGHPWFVVRDGALIQITGIVTVDISDFAVRYGKIIATNPPRLP